MTKGCLKSKPSILPLSQSVIDVVNPCAKLEPLKVDRAQLDFRSVVRVAERRSIGIRKAGEDIVEASVFLNDEDNVLDLTTRARVPAMQITRTRSVEAGGYVRAG